MKHKIREEKKALREILPKKDALMKSGIICERLIALPEFKSAKTILFYIPIKNEAGTMPAILAAKKQNKVVGAPRIENGRILPKKLDLKKLKIGLFGVPEPYAAANIPMASIDLVVVPGVAFDLQGNRMGYGKGYYDSFLQKLPHAKKIALAYELQIVAHFEKEPHDIAVGKIITEKRIIDCSKTGKH
ncbi:MAG: 5-formyltetrahydrofolate cyclo-ligase [Candidatus Micrarchaeota archaeon]